MATLPLRSPVRPAHDEWGVYDPEQAGLSALFAKLDARAKAEKAADDVAAKPAALSDLRDTQ